MQAAGKITVQPWMRAPATVRVLSAVTSTGAVARFVGGCVRDAILERPVHDIDIALAMPPDQVMRLLQDAGITAVPTGIAHGTVTAVIDGQTFEITTLRADIETFGRRAKVAFVDDWMADAARRDFTFNAMFAAPDGTLYDPFGGQADLRAGCVRFVGDAATRIGEDVLRLLRYFRFHAYYGRTAPDDAALQACAASAHLLPTLSGERVAGELLRLLGAPAPAEILQLMADRDVLRHVLPDATAIATLRELVSIEDRRGDVDALRRLGAVLAVDGTGAAAVADRLRLSNRRKRRLTAIAEPGPVPNPAMPAATRRHFLYQSGVTAYRDRVMISWAEARNDTDNRGGTAEAWEAVLALADTWTAPAFPLRGTDALARGLSPGPAVGNILRGLETWWIDGDFRADRAACLAELDRVLAATRS